MKLSSNRIKQALEEIYDIPFVLIEAQNGNDPIYRIHPRSQGEELFEVKITFRQNTRIIIEILPERYASAMINDMCNASVEKKEVFSEYANLLITQMKASFDLQISNEHCNPLVPSEWPGLWTAFSCRLSKSPVTSEDEKFDAVDVATQWAVPVFGMVLALLNIVPVDSVPHKEGTKYSIVSNRYERNPVNRQLCLSVNGYKCKICGFDFEQVYGEVGKDFIHVHHIEPVSKYAEAKVINPAIDLIPVCPNCHAMLHRSDPPMQPEELKRIIHAINRGQDQNE